MPLCVREREPRAARPNPGARPHTSVQKPARSGPRKVGQLPHAQPPPPADEGPRVVRYVCPGRSSVPSARPRRSVRRAWRRRSRAADGDSRPPQRVRPQPARRGYESMSRRRRARGAHEPRTASPAPARTQGTQPAHTSGAPSQATTRRSRGAGDDSGPPKRVGPQRARRSHEPTGRSQRARCSHEATTVSPAPARTQGTQPPQPRGAQPRGAHRQANPPPRQGSPATVIGALAFSHAVAGRRAGRQPPTVLRPCPMRAWCACASVQCRGHAALTLASRHRATPVRRLRTRCSSPAAAAAAAAATSAGTPARAPSWQAPKTSEGAN